MKDIVHQKLNQTVQLLNEEGVGRRVRVRVLR